jgi:hypothetical protein
MAIELHTIELAPGTVLQNSDRAIIGVIADLATSAGGGAGQAVTKTVSGLSLPAAYTVQVTPSQDAVAYVASKTSSGFVIHLYPRLAANTLSTGTVDVIIVA